MEVLRAGLMRTGCNDDCVMRHVAERYKNSRVRRVKMKRGLCEWAMQS
ncbi:MAG: hypothetical protein LUQ31_06285 [Methanoregula sp.]|nr:hypothetical protein [Methanoregula sp.]